VYSTCLFCNQPLGANEVVEAFPVGRRLAFDQQRGRLWVVCRKCAKWNLTPLEERWEAIETCEKLFRDSRKRVVTDQIGLAKLSEGLELVRIGEPQRPEFAAWRYGDVFTRRRKRALIAMNVGGVAGVGSFLANFTGILGATTGIVGVSLMSVQLVAQYSQILQMARLKRRVVGRFVENGKHWLVRGRHAQHLRLVPSSSGWAAEIPSELGARKRVLVFEGAEARQLMAKVVPQLTFYGGKKDDVTKAVNALEAEGDPDRYLRRLANNPRQWSSGTIVGTLLYQGIVPILAVEMAVNEENERRALQGELALLEAAWKEAEEVASISDKLVLPEGVEARLGALKGSAGKSKSDSESPPDIPSR
jgi:hypothetical protein